jgi:Zn-dependent protease
VHTSFRIGRIAGIEIGANWSWLIVFGLIVWSLDGQVFPATDPGLARRTYLAMALVAAGLFYVSLLLHELGHALQARREGIRIQGITLWLFGGVARLAGPIPSAGAEFRVAIAGPLVSLVLGGLFSALAALLALPRPVDGVLAWLGYTNLILLVFNLIPALPLDGGRVLRSALWRRSGDLLRATSTAVRIGRGLALLLVAAGGLLLVVQGTISGLWLVFVGVFLLQAASAEERYVRAMVPELTVGRFLGEGGAIAARPLVAGGQLIGLLSFRPAGGPVPPEGLPRVDLREPLLPALERVAGAGDRRALVMDGDRVTGLLSFAAAAPWASFLHRVVSDRLRRRVR